MRKWLLIAGFLASLALFACGSEGSTSTTKSVAPVPSSRPTSDETAAAPPKPKLRVPPGPPPKNLVVKVLKRGSGPGAKWGQRLRVRFVGVSYETGKEFEVHWGKSGIFDFTLGIEEVRKGWDIGLKGIKVGGRRELTLPSRLAYGTGALLYVVELVEIDPSLGGRTVSVPSSGN